LDPLTQADMPPQLALVLCTIFVAFLLRLDHKQAPEVSRSSWIPTIWLLYISSRALGSWFGTGGENIEAGSPMDQIFLIILLCACLFVIFKRRVNLSQFAKENSWLVVLIVYMLISILWSNMPGISFRRWMRELIAFVMYLQFFSERNPRLALQSIIRRTIYILIPFSLLLIKYYPEYGVQYGRWSGVSMWIGVALQKNGLAELCAISALFLIWTLIRRIRKRDVPVAEYQTYMEVFVLGLALYLLAGPQHSIAYSATATTALIIGLLGFISLYWMRKRRLVPHAKTLGLIIAIIFAYGTLTPFLGKLGLLDVSSLFGRTETLTGRAEIWATLIPFAFKRPVFGYGVGGFWTTAMRNLTSSHAHNGYLEVILSLGIAGLVIILLLYFAICRKAIRTMAVNFDWGVLFIAYVIVSLAHNVTEAGLESLVEPMAAIVFFLLVSSPPKFETSTVP